MNTVEPITITITIARGLLDQMIAAAAGSAFEVCGLLFGTGRRIESMQPVANVADDPARTFEVDPAALFAALRAERAGGPRLIGCYHSHPGGRPEPSPRDVATAEPGTLWLILGDGEARLWRAGAGGFVSVRLVSD